MSSAPARLIPIPSFPMSLRQLSPIALTLFVLSGACGGDSPDDASATPAGAPAAGGAAAQQAGGRRTGAVNLAASDVGIAVRGPIEEAVAINGDLRPIETVAVRSRIEGEVDAVHVREGQSVAAGQPLVSFESSEQQSTRASAEAERAAAQTELGTAQWNLEQSADLLKAGAIAERDHRAAQQAVATARARLAAAESRLRTSSLGLRDTRIVAPTAGVIERRFVQPGEHVSRGAQLLSLVRADVLELTAAVPARQANAVRTGQVVHFVADGRRFDGKVARVSPTIDPTTRSATVYVQVPNSTNALRGGTLATGQVVTRTVANALVVPMQAVRESPDGGQRFVYRIANGQLDRANVTLGVTDDARGLVEIRDGLAEGDQVVVGNVGTLGVGMKVTIAGERTGER